MMAMIKELEQELNEFSIDYPLLARLLLHYVDEKSDGK